MSSHFQPVCMFAALSPIPTYVLSNNPLASQYLQRILQDAPNVRFLEQEHLAECRMDAFVFVMEPSSSLLPVGECARQMCLRYPNARLVLVDRPLSDEDTAALLRTGIHGYVEYSSVAKDLVSAVQTVAGGDLWVTNRVLQAYAKPALRGDLAMTRREVQVLDLLKRNLSNKRIASILGVRESTVKYHASNIFGKLHVANRQELQPQPGRSGPSERFAFHWSCPIK
jgi:two-component system NarL family response regulator